MNRLVDLRCLAVRSRVAPAPLLALFLLAGLAGALVVSPARAQEADPDEADVEADAAAEMEEGEEEEAAAAVDEEYDEEEEEDEEIDTDSGSWIDNLAEDELFPHTLYMRRLPMHTLTPTASCIGT